MTNREAVIGEIEPYSLSDESVEKAFIDAVGRFNSGLGIDDDYMFDSKKTCNFAAMLCLNRLRTLTAENIGGISNSYDRKDLDKRIKAIARDAGISADLVLAEESEAYVKYAPVW